MAYADVIKIKTPPTKPSPIKITENEWAVIFALRDQLFKEMTGEEIYEYQREFSNRIIRSVILNKGLMIPSEWTRQSGKTTDASATVCFLMIYYFPICEKFGIKTTQQFNVGIFAPKFDQAYSDFVMVRGMLRKIKDKGLNFDFESFNGDTIRIKSLQEPPKTIYCMTASPTSNQESKTLNLIIFEEAQDLEDKVVDKAISPMGASTFATEVWIGVAGYRECKFHRFIESLPAEQKLIIPYDMVLQERQKRFELDGNEIHLNYYKHIQKRLAEIGMDSDEFKTQYRLIWVLERGQFITFENLMKLQADFPVNKQARFYAGIDWGKIHDTTILTIIDENCNIVAWHEWQGDSYATQIAEIVEIIKQYKNLQIIFCDSTGNQDMAVNILTEKVSGHGVRIEGVNFNPVTKDEMYKNLSRLMHDTILGGFVVQPAPLKMPVAETLQKAKFTKQMLDLQKEIKNEKWRCNHPQGPQYHDDYCDSIALACLAFSPGRESSYEPSIY